MKFLFFILSLSLVLSLSACGSEKVDENPSEAQELSTAGGEEASSADGLDGLSPFGEVHPPVQHAGLQVGDTVLAPSFNWIRDMYAEGPESVTFIYYNQKVKEVKEFTTVLESVGGESMEVANALIIPIPNDAKAQVGDILLTWWQSGSGMQRAIVVGGTETEPVVRYLGLDYDNPSKNSDGVPIGQADATLKPGTFFVLEEGMMVGNRVVAKADSSVSDIVSISGDSILTLGFAGRVKQFSKKDVDVIPNKIEVKVGDTIQAEHIGKLRPAVVTAIDEKIGRVFAETEFAGKAKGLALAFGEFTK